MFELKREVKIKKIRNHYKIYNIKDWFNHL